MMKIFLPLLIALSLVGCSKKAPGTGTVPAHSTSPVAEMVPDESAWYWSWIKEDVASGAKFHSEFSLASGDVKSIDVTTNRRIEVGVVLREGYEIFKSGGSVSLGTVQEPRRASGTPGFSQSFAPVDGMVRLRIENTSKLATRIAVHIKEVDDKR